MVIKMIKSMSIQDLINTLTDDNRTHLLKIQFEIENRIRLLKREKRSKQKRIALDGSTIHPDEFDPIKEIVIIVEIDKLSGAIEELERLHGNYSNNAMRQLKF